MTSKVLRQAGWVGKGKDPHQAALEHQSRPLATLKDPEAFGPPPKNVNYHGGAAVPNAITPDRRGLGAPLSAEEIHAQRVHEESEKRDQEEAAQKPPPPPVPYRVDTTGLSTGNLPKPPIRRIDATDPSSSYSSPQAVRPSTKPKPSLPPRLPPRDAVTPTHDPPPSYTTAVEGSQAFSGLNHGALNRLGSAGISLPGLNIGGQSEASQGEAVNSPAESTATPKPTLSELHTRFSGQSARSPASESASAGGTSFAQKQAALKTASSFRKDPTSVSLSDAKATAATANNFRERHGGQVASSFQTANALNQKYNVAGQFSDDTNNTPVKEGVAPSPSAIDDSHSLPFNIKKKPPPPPPPKRGMGNDTESTGSPPPVPLSSKPRP